MGRRPFCHWGKDVSLLLGKQRNNSAVQKEEWKFEQAELCVPYLAPYKGLHLLSSGPIFLNDNYQSPIVAFLHQPTINLFLIQLCVFSLQENQSKLQLNPITIPKHTKYLLLLPYYHLYYLYYYITLHYISDEIKY